jgi:DNA-directed RNA polymerase specialized sigma24 family protein
VELVTAQAARYLLRVVDLDALYREHAPAIAASLARAFGARRLDLIEAAVQEAFISAIERWGAEVPERPGAWLQVAARRRVIDAIRRAAWIAPSEALDQRALAGDPPSQSVLLSCAMHVIAMAPPSQRSTSSVTERVSLGWENRDVACLPSKSASSANHAR